MRTTPGLLACHLGLSVLLATMSACSSTTMAGNALLITEPTAGPNDLTLTVTVGTRTSVSGMQVDTVGPDTIVTLLKQGRARRFILAGLINYRGRIRLDSVDLVIGDTSVWITSDRIKAHGPAGTIDVPLRDEADKDLFGDRDIILRNGKVSAVE
ncbi:MAG: hypothetical protein NXI31_10360 [bacterium]|nr:hypothetical protein [bacterium]